jgi:WD40 repeat protein
MMNAAQTSTGPFGQAAAAAVDPSQTRVVQELKHTRPLFSCRFDPSGRFVFAGAQDKTVERWELASEQKSDLVGHESWVRGIAFAPRGGCMYTGDYTGRLCCWPCDAGTPTPAWTINAHEGWVRSVSVSPDGQVLATSGNDGLVKWWSATDGKPIRTLSGHGSHVYNTAFYPSGLHFVSADLHGTIRHWEVPSGAPVRQLDASLLHKYDTTFRADIGGVRGMTFSSDGRYLACAGISDVTNAFAGTGKPVVVLFDWRSGRQKMVLRTPDGFLGVTWGVVFHPAGYVIGVGGGISGGGGLWFWNPEQPMAFFSQKLASLGRDLDLHPDGTRLAIAHFDGVLRLYDMSPKPAAS